MAEGVRYIKVAKVDKDGIDQTNTLQSMTVLTIPYSSGNVTYDILNTTEYPTHFVYYVENPNIDWDDRADIEYNCSALPSGPSFKVTPPIINPTPMVLTPTIDNLNFITSQSIGSGYRLFTYPQKEIIVRASGSITIAGASGDNHNIGIYLNNTLIESSPNFIAPGPSTFDISSSFLSLSPNDNITLAVLNIVTFQTTIATFSPDTTFTVTSSIATGPEMNSIAEPYFSQDFSKALDCQPLLNNVLENRKSTTYQDIDYSSGQVTPTNFELLINGTALKAEVQDSNYTLLRHTNPRYNGSRSTSQELNKWSEGDTGTYGKSPTAESLKTIVAYCTDIGGYPPERMGSSGIFVKYLIKSDGSVVIPNTTPNSLADNQDTFINGERISIHNVNLEANSTSGGSGEDNYRTVIQGGKRIEPILYTQIGHSPAAWADTITLTDRNAEGGVSMDFQSSLSPYDSITGNNYVQGTIQAYGEGKFPTIVSEGNDANMIDPSPTSDRRRLKIDSDMISEGISIQLQGKIKITNNTNDPSSAYVRFYNYTQNYSAGWGGVNGSGGIGAGNQSNPMNISYNIPYNELVLGDEWGIEIHVGHAGVYYEGSSRWNITQSPTPNNSILVPGLFRSGSGLSNPDTNIPWDYTLFSTSSALVEYFDSHNTYQEDISASGFFDISIPWSIKSGDEFRFEGREDRVFLIKDAYVSSSVLIVEVDSPIPTSGSMNLDEFLIRRYVDEANGVIMQGSKPQGSTGPYIIKPEYLSEGMDKNIDIYIQNLTEKGLI